MKSMPWGRKAFKKARHLRAAERVDHSVVSLKTGEMMYYVTHDGKKHKPNNCSWKCISEPLES